MAEIHVLGGGERDGIQVKQLAFHYTVASPIAAAAQDPALAAFESAVPDITAGELADIQGGTVVERVVPFEIHSNVTDNAELISRAYALKDSLDAEVQATYQGKYRAYLATPARPA